MTPLQIYFPTEFVWPEMIFPIIALIMILLGMLPLGFLLHPRRFQKKTDKDISVPAGGWPGISVVVYSRDEASSLEQLLESLFVQKYEGAMEIIIADDGCNDDTGNVVKRMMHKFGNMRITFVPDEARNLSRRKMALTLGIKSAKYDIVVLTCADAVISSDRWLASIASLFEPGIDVVVAPAIPKKLYGCGLVKIMRRLDMAMTTLTWMSAALYGMTYRGDCHNLALRKQIFFEHNGYSKTLNLHFGDDDLFVKEISNRKNVAVNVRREGLVKIDWRMTPKYMIRAESARRLFTTRKLGRGVRAFVSMLVWTTWLNFISVAISIAFYRYNGYVLIGSLVALSANWVIVSLWLSRSARFLRLRMPVVWLVPSLMFRPILSANRRIRMLKTKSTNFTWQKLQK